MMDRAYHHVDDMRELGRYVHIPNPYIHIDDLRLPYEHINDLRLPYVPNTDPQIPYIHQTDGIPYVHQTDASKWVDCVRSLRNETIFIHRENASNCRLQIEKKMISFTSADCDARKIECTCAMYTKGLDDYSAHGGCVVHEILEFRSTAHDIELNFIQRPSIKE